MHLGQEGGEEREEERPRGDGGPDLTAPCKDLGFSPEGVGRCWRAVGFPWLSLAAGGDSSVSRETSKKLF